MHSIQLYGLYRGLIQRTQNKIPCMITNAYRYVTNKKIHKDLKVKRVEENNRECAIKHDRRLVVHRHVEAIHCTINEIRRF